jgi:xanthine/CO dehydrogenase XdhC/CoxF family maturation factor
MTEVSAGAPSQLVVVTRNVIADAIRAIAEIADRRVVVLGDDDPEGTPRERLALQPPTVRDAVVLTDHDAPEAYDLLRALLRSEAGYVAMLASRSRAANVLTLLRDEGFDPAALTRLHVPAGLDIGGKLPGEIALSVVAEVVAWSHDRPGGPLREGRSAGLPA